jgi:hypothetical protein
MTEPNEEVKDDPTKKPDTGEQPITETLPEAEKPKADEKKFTQAELDQHIKERLQREKAKGDQAIKEAKEKADEEALKQQGEFKKLAELNEQKAKDLEAKLASRELLDKKAAIAKKVGLPDGLAARLIGDTDEAIEADAKALFDSLPKSSKAALGATNPGGNNNGSKPQTSRELIASLSGQIPGESLFNPDVARRSGGGVFDIEPKDE